MYKYKGITVLGNDSDDAVDRHIGIVSFLYFLFLRFRLLLWANPMWGSPVLSGQWSMKM